MQKITSLAVLTGLALMANVGVSNAGSDSVAKVAPATSGMLLPLLNPAKGRKLFASKGCVVCHSINGIGGEDAPVLDAATMPAVMNPFDFAAKMWQGAGTMIAMQEDELGEQIDFNGTELANIIAFVHNAEEQKKFTEADIPPKISKLMVHIGTETEEHETEEHDKGKSRGMMMKKSN